MADDLKPQPIEILLVDDNDDDVVLLEESFRDSHFVNLLQVVHDGEEAILYLRRQGRHQNAKVPGLVLLDINMPKKNGFEVLQIMKSDPVLRTIPVVMLTTSTRDEDIVRSYDGGACSFVSKPVNFEKLKEVIKQFTLYWTLVSVIPPLRMADAGAANLK
ncbi:MAG TPA: response regulator [Planctomycetaceae bacterium]|nr:response regulator [Planctomycetaceae bacterium]